MGCATTSSNWRSTSRRCRRANWAWLVCSSLLGTILDELSSEELARLPDLVWAPLERNFVYQ
jgi:hypothetical protein